MTFLFLPLITVTHPAYTLTKATNIFANLKLKHKLTFINFTSHVAG